MFHDTTRLRLMSRPSLKDALQSFSGQQSGSSKLGRIGMSQSFREKMTGPVRPRDPPPPPPMLQLVNDGTSGSSYSLAKKLFSFNKTEIRRINRFLGIGESEQRDPRAIVTDNNIYDIAENEELSSDIGVTVVDNSKFYTSNTVSSVTTTCPDPLPQATGAAAVSLKKNVSLRLRPKSNEFSGVIDPVKPPRAKRERSKSFTPSNPLVKTSLFNRSLSHIPKSASNSSLNGKSGVMNTDASKKIVINNTNNNTNEDSNESKRTFSSSDLVTIFPDEERRSFKDIRKILSSPSISSSCSSSSTNQIYRPKSQLSNSSSVINNSIREEHIVVVPAALSKAKETFVDHIYEEIQDKDVDNLPSSQCKRPLPPLPSEKQPSPSRSSPIISDPSSPVKSIFEGASKYDILNYLEDARERGLTDCDLDIEEEEEEAGDDDDTGDDTPAIRDTTAPTAVILSVRNHSNRISNISTGSRDSHDSCESGEQDRSGDNSGDNVINKEKLSSVEIERNDSGLGSETGRCRSVSKVVVRKRSDQEPEDVTCLDCDHVLDTAEL